MSGTDKSSMEKDPGEFPDGADRFCWGIGCPSNLPRVVLYSGETCTIQEFANMTRKMDSTSKEPPPTKTAHGQNELTDAYLSKMSPEELEERAARFGWGSSGITYVPKPTKESTPTKTTSPTPKRPGYHPKFR